MVKGGDSPVLHVVLEVVSRHRVRAHMRPVHPGGACREAVELEGMSENSKASEEESEADSVTGQIVKGQLFCSVKTVASEQLNSTANCVQKLKLQLIV